MTTIPEDKLEGIISKGKELEKQLGQENTSEKFVELSKEYSEIQPLYNASMEWKESSKEIADLKNIIDCYKILVAGRGDLSIIFFYLNTKM